ncbi:PLDc N-terminal domain-containing protein [Paenibacillus kobensis]|uniref:PLDc N-terminal domain-containing protein n=1 Tax=Paenibacillus kobensis TaxID=59841 RepID=UPI0013E33C97|nr:PLDc N-terminal domain-containing protein [Paenibacillus kobensis]
MNDTGGAVATGFGFMVLLFLFIGIALFVIHLITIVWTYRDAVRQGHDPLYALVFAGIIFFFPILGFIVYLLVRKSN